MIEISIQHMQVLCGKVSHAMGFLKNAKKFEPKDTFILMYRGMVEPHFATAAQFGEVVAKLDCKF